jgi:hypothetical protein
VDPSAVSVLTSLVTGVLGGAAGEAGKQAWQRLTRLVRGRFDRDDPTTRALEQVDLVSGDQQMVEAVGGILAQRLSDSAQRDQRFSDELAAWMGEAARVVNAGGEGDVSSTISDSTINGPVIQGRDFGTVNLGTPPPEHD